MTWLVSVAGAVVVVVVLVDVFHTLWHPSGQGRITKVMLRAIWTASGRLGTRARQLGGPLGMVAVIATWGALAIVGFALVYWPHLPGGFNYSPGLSPHRSSHVVDALYLSFLTLATLGFGDIVPTTAWLRLTTPVEALLGFALLTAAVSWVLQVYPALTRRRTLALRLRALRDAHTLEGLEGLGPTAAAQLLHGLADTVAAVRIDLTQYSETYFFRDTDRDTALAATVGYAYDLANRGQRVAASEVRHAAAVLGRAIDDLAAVVDGQFLHTHGSTAEVLEAYTEDQDLSPA